MGDVRSGHHGDWVYVFEDQGFDTSPNDTTQKVFGSDLTTDDFGADWQAVRKYNASRTAAEIIKQNFDGAWGCSFDLSEPPWWLAAIFGQPTSTNVSGSLYDYKYDLSHTTNPVTLRLYAPTDGFSNYEMLAGATIVSCTVDQSPDGSPEVSLAGGYAKPPVNQSTPSLTIPSLSESTYANRHAEVKVDGSTLGRSQNTNLSIETGTELTPEIGAENKVDYSPKAFNPDLSYSHIRWVGETVDLLQRFRNASQVTNNLVYDNDETGDDTYKVDFSVTGSFPGNWSETGRNDLEADLVSELQDMAEDVNVTVTTSAGSSGNPPGITL